MLGLHLIAFLRVLQVLMIWVMWYHYTANVSKLIEKHFLIGEICSQIKEYLTIFLKTRKLISPGKIFLSLRQENST